MHDSIALTISNTSHGTQHTEGLGRVIVVDPFAVEEEPKCGDRDPLAFAGKEEPDQHEWMNEWMNE